jgi:membrane protein implicated in regulation of membrane protease activity
VKKETLATGGVLGLSFLIASCCVAPALFLLFGISVSALGVLAVFEPYRPIFIALGAAALLYAAQRIYRRDVTAGDRTRRCGTSADPYLARGRRFRVRGIDRISIRDRSASLETREKEN